MAHHYHQLVRDRHPRDPRLECSVTPPLARPNTKESPLTSGQSRRINVTDPSNRPRKHPGRDPSKHPRTSPGITLSIRVSAPISSTLNGPYPFTSRMYLCGSEFLLSRSTPSVRPVPLHPWKRCLLESTCYVPTTSLHSQVCLFGTRATHNHARQPSCSNNQTASR